MAAGSQAKAHSEGLLKHPLSYKCTNHHSSCSWWPKQWIQKFKMHKSSSFILLLVTQAVVQAAIQNDARCTAAANVFASKCTARLLPNNTLLEKESARDYSMLRCPSPMCMWVSLNSPQRETCILQWDRHCSTPEECGCQAGTPAALFDTAWGNNRTSTNLSNPQVPYGYRLQRPTRMIMSAWISVNWDLPMPQASLDRGTWVSLILQEEEQPLLPFKVFMNITVQTSQTCLPQRTTALFYFDRPTASWVSLPTKIMYNDTQAEAEIAPDVVVRNGMELVLAAMGVDNATESYIVPTPGTGRLQQYMTARMQPKNDTTCILPVPVRTSRELTQLTRQALTMKGAPVWLRLPQIPTEAVPIQLFVPQPPQARRQMTTESAYYFSNGTNAWVQLQNCSLINASAVICQVDPSIWASNGGELMVVLATTITPIPTTTITPIPTTTPISTATATPAPELLAGIVSGCVVVTIVIACLCYRQGKKYAYLPLHIGEPMLQAPVDIFLQSASSFKSARR